MEIKPDPPSRTPAEAERLARMFDQAPNFMAMLREPGHIFELANTAYRQLIRHRPVIGLSFAEALPDMARQGLLALLDRVVASGQPHSGHAVPLILPRLSQHPIEERLIDFVYQPIVDADGCVTGIFIDGSDVTDRVHAEQRLALSEESLRLATEMAEIGTWDLDLCTDVLRWSDRTKAMFGISPNVPCSMDDFYAGLHPDDRAATGAAFAAAVDPAMRESYDVEYRTIGKEDGRIRWIAARGRGIFEGDVCTRAIGTTIDISRRKAAEQDLRESEARFRSMADTAPALIWVYDAAGAMTFANQWHERTFGCPVAELMGDGRRRILHPDGAADFCADFATAFAAREDFGRDVRVIDRHGHPRWLHSEARPRFADDMFVGYVGCDVDITDVHLAAEALERGIDERTSELAGANRALTAQIEERERVEETLRQMQRLEAIGQLTSGVAHDFNNLLTVVLGNLDMVERGGTLEDRVAKRLGHVRTAAERGATLTAQLLAFSRRQRLEARAIDLNETVSGMRDLLQSSMGGSVRLQTALKPDLWPAMVDPTQIELIILNLAINARDAMQVGGSLTVETDNVTLGAPARAEEPAAGDYVMIAVRDDGSGMTSEVLAKAFEPFFTTKEVGKGSGLGLAQVYGFAKQSGGGVAIDTRPGAGTTVRVYLPRSNTSGTAIEQTAPDAPLAARAPGSRLLLVDDDPAVRAVSADMLRGIGCTVVEADCGAAALDILDALDRAGGPQFDLLVLDFAMPGMNGAELAGHVRARWPDLPVLFVTGFADLTAIAEVSEDAIVQKPFRGDELPRKALRLLCEPRMAAC